MSNLGPIVDSIIMADKAFGLAGKLVDFIQQRHPDLDIAAQLAVPDAGARYDDALEAARKREQEQSAIRGAFPIQDEPPESEDTNK